MNSELINKYIAGNASQEEKEAIQLWIESNEKNRKMYMSLRSLYDITIGHMQEEKRETIVSRNKKQLFFIDLLKIAAAIIITFGCTYVFLQSRQKEVVVFENTSNIVMQTLHVPTGQRAELTLADGTRVWLNSRSTLTFPNYFTEASRDVYLDGEGYFDIAHNENKPFCVNTSAHVIKALGTEFNVFAYSENGYFETSLLNGSVEISTQDNQQIISLAPGNRAYWEDNQLMISSIRYYDYFLWRKGIISFDNEQVEDILKKLEFYYDISIDNRNKSISKIRYTGKFRTKDGIEHVLNVLKVPTGLRFHKDSEKNIVRIY